MRLFSTCFSINLPDSRLISVKYIFTFLLFACVSLHAQDTTRPVMYSTTQQWLCTPQEGCGTWQKPAILRYTPVNCPDSMVDSNSFYSLFYMYSPRQGKKMWCKIPSDRNVYFINQGDLPDTFTINLNGNLLQMIRDDISYSAKVLQDGPSKSFHLDIQLPKFNGLIERNSYGNVNVMNRTPKRK